MVVSKNVLNSGKHILKKELGDLKACYPFSIYMF